MRRDRSTPIRETFELYLQDIGKGRGGSGGNYRRNVARELDRFAAWVAGDSGPIDRTPPTVADLDERVFRAYARHLAGDRGLKNNTVQTYYAYVSAWCGWLVDEGYLDGHYAQRATATSPLPTDDGRKPGDQQAWSPDQRHALTRYADRRAREAIDALGEWDDSETTTGRNEARERTTGNDECGVGRETTGERARRERQAIRAARDRALVYVLAYTAVRVGEVVRDPDDPRRRGLRWEDVNVADRSLTVYRKKQSWDATGIPDPVVPPLRRYRRLLDPPDDRWPVFPTFDKRTLSETVTTALADRGLQSAEVDRLRDRPGGDLFVARAENVRPLSVTTDGARAVLRRLTDAADIDVEHPKHDYLAPHGGRRGMGEVLVRAFGYTVAARYLDNSETMVRERYSHIEAGELGDVATDALDEIDPDGVN